MPRQSVLNLLVRMENACFAAPWTEEHLRQELSRANSIRIFLDAAGNVQEISADDDPGKGPWEGYCLVRLPEGPGDEPAEIMRIALLPEARGRGLAGKLLAHGEDLARERLDKNPRFLLEVSAANPAARKLYARAGYEEIHRREKYYRDGSDALILEKRPL